MPWSSLFQHSLFQQWSGSARQRIQPLRARLAQDPYYRFQNFEEVQLAAALGIGIDVNRATIDDWLRLPGLSIHQARLLASLSQSGVQFHCLDDIAAALDLPVQRIQPLAEILQFRYYDPASICAVQTVALNTASVEQLTQIPAVDLFLARQIVHHRRQSGNFRNLADLQTRLALSPQLTEALLHYIRF